MEIGILLALALIAGAGTGFAACYMQVVRPLIESILTMRMAGFDPGRNHKQTVDSPSEAMLAFPNET